MFQKTSLKHYVDYLDEIIGFFVVEDHILLTEPSLGTAAHKDSLWENALKHVIQTMNTDFVSFPSAIIYPVQSSVVREVRSVKFLTCET